MTPKNAAKFGFGLALSVLFIWLIFRAIPMQDVAETLSKVRPVWVVAAVVCFLIDYLFRIARWRLMLQIDNPDVTMKMAGIPFMVSIAANNVLPLRAGDVMRAFAFSNWLNVPSSSVLATLVAERLLDFLSLLVCLAVALSLLGLGSDNATALLGVGAIGLYAIAACVAFALVFPHVLQPLVLAVVRLIGRFAAGLAAGLEKAIGNLFQTLKKMTRSGRTLRLIALSAAAWGFEALVFYCAARSVPGLVDSQAAWLAMPVGTLSTLLPSSPGYVGTFHFFVIKATQMLGNPAAAAAAFAVVAHLVLWLTATVIGGVCFALWTLSGTREYDT